MHSRRDWHTQILSDCNQWYQHTVVVIQCTHLDTTICTAIPCINPSEQIGTYILNYFMCCLCKQVLCTGLLKCSQFIPAEGPDCMTYMPAMFTVPMAAVPKSIWFSRLNDKRTHWNILGRTELNRPTVRFKVCTSNWAQGSSDCS